MNKKKSNERLRDEKFLARSFRKNNRHGERHRVRDLLKEISRYDKVDDFDDLEFEE